MDAKVELAGLDSLYLQGQKEVMCLGNSYFYHCEQGKGALLFSPQNVNPWSYK